MLMFLYHCHKAEVLLEEAASTSKVDISKLLLTYRYQLPDNVIFQTESLIGESINHLEKAVHYATGLSEAEIYRQIGRLYLLLNQPQAALSAYSKVLELTPDSLLTRIEIGLAYERLMPSDPTHSIELMHHLQNVQFDNWLLPERTASQFGWWSALKETTYPVVKTSSLYIQDISSDKNYLVIRIGLKTDLKTEQSLANIRIAQRTYHFLLEGGGWHTIALDLKQTKESISDIRISIKSDVPTGIANVQFIDSRGVVCFLVNCLQQASAAWQSTGLDFAHAATEFSRLADYDEALIWYQRYQLILGDEHGYNKKPDNLTMFEDTESLYIVDSFISTHAWKYCFWCKSMEDRWFAKDGVLTLFLNDLDTNRSVAIFRDTNINISGYSQLILRAWADSNARLTMEIVIDGIRCRVLNYQSLHPGNDMYTIPINGEYISHILVAMTADPTGEANKAGSETISLSIDWIILK
jgi:tetratricopeptide (TPR) repeat protein